MIEDQLSWDKFYEVSKNQHNIKDIEPFNRLIAHSKNLFIISGYGAFTPGYLLIISKDFLPSFGLIDEKISSELSFMIDISKKTISKIYNRNSVIFEHGMCACIGGLDRAHLHIMSVPLETSVESLTETINETLYERKAGIKYIKYKDYKLENIHDINQIFEDKKNLNNNDFQIFGEIYKIKEIQNLPIDQWPLITLNHINKGGHYVYFKSDFNETSFLTTHNFNTQFGRQVVFNNEKKLSNDFNSTVTKIQKDNKYLEVWKWQNCMFKNNIIDTIIKSKDALRDLKKNHLDQFKKYNFEII
tara:strand:- start:2459 stop:3364 length:906 start_codon:yes stop_codon:yes gene_type:complete